MEFPLKEIWAILQTYGGPGIVILVMGWWIWRLEKDKTELINKLLVAYQKGAEITEKGTEATNSWVRANQIREVALGVTVDSIKAQAITLAALQEVIRSLGPEMRELFRELVASHNRLREGLIEFRGKFQKDA